MFVLSMISTEYGMKPLITIEMKAKYVAPILSLPMPMHVLQHATLAYLAWGQFSTTDNRNANVALIRALLALHNVG